MRDLRRALALWLKRAAFRGGRVPMDNILSCWVPRPVTREFSLHFDVSSRLQTLEFRALLLQVVGWRNAGAADEARLDAMIAGYRASATTRVLAVTVEGACIGIRALDLVAPARASSSTSWSSATSAGMGWAAS